MNHKILTFKAIWIFLNLPRKREKSAKNYWKFYHFFLERENFPQNIEFLINIFHIILQQNIDILKTFFNWSGRGAGHGCNSMSGRFFLHVLVIDEHLKHVKRGVALPYPSMYTPYCIPYTCYIQNKKKHMIP